MNITHESANLHVSGKAIYIDDIPVNNLTLIGRVVYSPYSFAKIISYDLSSALKVKGIHCILSAKDIPGHNEMGPVIADEPCLADTEVTFIGQAIFLIAGDNEDICREAEKKIKINFEPLEPILDIETAIQKNNLLAPIRKMERGDPVNVIKTCEHTLKGSICTGAQEHWYLETQIALCIPGEGNEIKVYCGTQHPSETQTIVAEVLGIQKNEVVVETRRIGGAFGGKETQANPISVWTALLCKHTKRPVKIRLFRDDDQIMTGKRHPFLINYECGFDNNGRLNALIIEYNCDGGATTDLTRAILERAMLHADNCYFIPHISVTGKAWKTNTPSNTAFRGFGGPQGMVGIETVMDRIARYLHKEPLEVRNLNFYGVDQNNITHYDQRIENNRIHLIHNKLVETSQYHQRRKEINEFNSINEFYKKGIAMTPVKFGISFTTSFLNQAGALVNIYKDGTVLVNQGGVEMGQGLYTKIQQIAALELGIHRDHIKVNATNTSKVPNTSATAASAGTDLNGMAVKDAIDTLKNRISRGITDFFNQQFASEPTDISNIIFQNDLIFDSIHPERKILFADAMVQMHLQQISLSATGFYKTPDIGFDKEKGKGKPFHYFAFGMAVSEVMIDVLTGAHKWMRTDILHDVGDSINPGIDIGQIDGGYIQGIGWCTTEEVKRDKAGCLLNHSPDTYKIPGAGDIPIDFRTELLKDVPNPNTIRKSKAVAEPPLMLAISGWLAIKDAISSVGQHKFEPEFSLPATNEVILLSIEAMVSKLLKK